MNENFKRFPKLLILFLVICFSGCQKDDVIESSKVPILNELTVFKIEKSISPDIIKNYGLSDRLATLASKINSNKSTLNRSVSFSEYGFSVDTEVANYIEFGNYHSYTFPLIRDIDNGLMENVLLSLENDGSYKVFLVSYDITAQEKQQIQNNEEVDLNGKVSYTIIEDNDLGNSLLTRTGGVGDGGCYDFVDVVPRCRYLGRHTAEDIETGSNGGFDCAQKYEGIPEPYRVLYLTECGQGGFGITPNNDPSPYDDYGNPIGQGGGNTIPILVDNPVTIPIVPSAILSPADIIECTKVTDFINDPANNDFKQELIDLGSEANLNLNFEKGIAKYENTLGVSNFQGTGAFPEVAFTAGVNKFTVMGHNHPNTVIPSLPTFSPGDLIGVARGLRNNQIDPTSFVVFVTTKQGTQYAITINDSAKFLDFFYYKTFNNALDVPPTQIQKYFNSRDIFKPLFDEYFNPEETPKITPTTPNEDALREFLNFMNAADAGFTLFETDETFNTYTIAKSDNNGVAVRLPPCQ